MAMNVAQVKKRPARTSSGLGRAAHRQAINPQRWLAHADWHALAFFAAGTNAAVECHVVANHADFFQALWTTADDGGAFDRVQNFTVFNPIRFAG